MPPITVQSGLFRREVLLPQKSPSLEFKPPIGDHEQATPASARFEPHISNKSIKSLECLREITQARVDYLWDAYNEGSILSFITKESLFVIWQLNVAHIDFPPEWFDGIVESLIATEFPRLAIEAYMKHISSIDTRESVEPCRWIENCFGVLINFSELSERFQNAVAAVGAIELIIGRLRNSDEFMVQARADKRRQDLLECKLVLMYNLARGLQMRSHFEACDAAKVLEAYFHCKHSDYVRVIAAMCGARIDAGWPEACQLWSPPDDQNKNKKCILRLLFDYISLASLNENRRYRGISVYEFAECFRLLAITDKDKELLVKEGILCHIGMMLNCTVESEQSEAIDLLFALCSGKTNRSEICSAVIDDDEDCMQPLHWLADSSDSEGVKDRAKRFRDFVRIEVAGSKGELSGYSGKKSLHNTSTPAVPVVTRPKPTFYLSFNKEDSMTVKRIERLLIGSNFKVVNSALNTNRAVSEEALPKANLAAICYSEAYCSSSQCRDEAESIATSMSKNFIAFRIDTEFEPPVGSWLAQLLERALVRVDLDESLSNSCNEWLQAARNCVENSC